MFPIPRAGVVCIVSGLVALGVCSSAFAARSVSGILRPPVEQFREIDLHKSIFDFLTLDQVSARISDIRNHALEFVVTVKSRLRNMGTKMDEFQHTKEQARQLAADVRRNTENLRDLQKTQKDFQQARLRDLNVRNENLLQQRQDLARTLSAR